MFIACVFFCPVLLKYFNEADLSDSNSIQGELYPMLLKKTIQFLTVAKELLLLEIMLFRQCRRQHNMG